MRSLATLLILTACSSKTQSFHDGVQALCELPAHVPAPTTDSYEKRLAVVADWAEHHITNAEAKQVGSLKSIGANKDALAAAVAKAGIQHCQLLDNGMELQTFGDAMKAFCDGGNQGPGYFKSHMLNTEVIRLVESLGDLSPADRSAKFRGAVTRAGLTDCAAMPEHASTANLAAPTVPDLGLEAADPTSTTTITPSAIVVEGKAVVEVKNGDVDPSEKEGGALGLKIPRLQNYAAALAANTKATTNPLVMTLVINPSTPYRLAMEVLYSIKAGGYRTFEIAVHAGAGMKAIPLALPDKKIQPPGAPHDGLGMVVSITKTKLLVWSIAGTEGTLAKPALSVAPDHIADVQKALVAIRDAHWKTGTRSPADREVILMADGTVPMQTLAELMVAVRTSPDGKELFPTPLLSSGFE